MSVRSVSPPLDRGHSYAFWAGTLAVALDTVLQTDDELTRLRARRLLEEFEAECARRERAIEEPLPARAKLSEFAARPERFFEDVE